MNDPSGAAVFVPEDVPGGGGGGVKGAGLDVAHFVREMLQLRLRGLVAAGIQGDGAEGTVLNGGGFGVA